MRTAIDYDLWLTGATTADISDARHARKLADELLVLFGVDDLLVTWQPLRSDETRTALWSELGSEAEELYGNGGINFRDPDARLFQAGLSWNRVPPREHASYRRNQGAMQNRLALHTDRSRLDEPAFRERYLDFARRMSQSLRVNFLYAYDRTVSDDRYGLAGLDAGLRDVYWLNVFGPPFVELIGEERLLSAPAERTEALGDGFVIVLASDLVLLSREAAAPIRAHIGERFFVPAEAPKRGFLRRGRGPQAEARPAFDWSGILIDD